MTNFTLSWDSFSADSPLPLSLILLFFVSAGWAALGIFSTLRRYKHEVSASTNVLVSKKMQLLQTWTYGYLHTVTYLSTAFVTVSFFLSGFTITGIILTALILISTAVYTEVDVVGSTAREPGSNDFSPLVFLEYLTTSYLPKAVWKMSGHPHQSVNVSDAPSSVYEKILEVFSLSSKTLSNHITPRVYDIKDVVGLQGAYLSLPALATILMTSLRPDGAISELEDNLLLFVTIGLTAVSAVLSPLLGDWEYFTHDANYSSGKTAVYSGLGAIHRALELVGRLGMYVFLFDRTAYMGAIMFVLEWFFMYATYVSNKDSTTGGRVHTLSHSLLSSFESVFFSFYRRISVDKLFTVHGNVMSNSIEFFRLIMRSATYVIGFSVVLQTEFEGTLEGVMIVAALAGAVISEVVNVVEILIVNRSQLSLGSEAKRVIGYWKTWYFCRTFLCCPNTAYVNRDKNIGGTPQNNFNYV